MKIYITADMMWGTGQKFFLGWIHGFVGEAIKAATGIMPQRLETPDGYCPTHSQWLSQWNPVTPSWHLSRIKKDDVVIGMEMPPNYMHQMKLYNRKFVNLIMHPVKYLDDLVWGVKTNLCDLKPRITEEKFCIGAGEIVGKIRRFLPPLGFAPCTAVIMGQASFNPTVVRECKMLALPMFESRLKLIMRQHPSIYVKPHPACPFDDATNEMLRDMRVSQTMENSYRILSEENVQTVCGISTSVLYEARYFGKESIFFANEDRTDGFVPISHGEFCSQTFWAQMLQSVSSVKFPKYPEWINETPNKLRSASGDWLAYGYVHNLGWRN